MRIVMMPRSDGMPYASRKHGDRKACCPSGETATEAVTAALAERLRRLEKTQNVDVILEDVRRISAQFRAQLKEPMTSVDHDEVLYDDSGLPK